MYQQHQTMTHQDVPTSPYHTSHVCANSSTTSLNHIPKTYTKVSNKIPLEIHHTIHDPNTINPHIKPCAKPHSYVALNVYQSYTKLTNKILSQCTIRYTNKTQTCTSNHFNICLKTFITTSSMQPIVPLNMYQGCASIDQ
jgi:hypothetical protein